MSKLITVSGVKGYVDENGTAWLHLEDVAKGLGFIEKKVDGTSYIRWARIGIYLTEFGFARSGEKDEFIPESVFYLLAMKASNQMAIAFQMKVANEILPSIRKTGSYSTKELSPQLQLLINIELKQNEMQKAISDTREAQHQIQSSITDHEFKLSEIDQKVTDKITLTSLEQSQLQGAVASRVRKFASKPYAGLYSALKREFGVPSYRDIRKSDLSRAFRFINAWAPRV